MSPLISSAKLLPGSEAPELGTTDGTEECSEDGDWSGNISRTSSSMSPS